MLAQATLEDLPRMLIETRKRSGLTQEELAQKLGVTADQVSVDENGGYERAGRERLIRVTEALVELLNKK